MSARIDGSAWGRSERGRPSQGGRSDRRGRVKEGFGVLFKGLKVTHYANVTLFPGASDAAFPRLLELRQT